MTTPNSGKDAESMSVLYFVDGKVKLYIHSGKFGSFLKNETHTYHIIWHLYSWVFIPEK